MKFIAAVAIAVASATCVSSQQPKIEIGTSCDLSLMYQVAETLPTKEAKMQYMDRYMINCGNETLEQNSNGKLITDYPLAVSEGPNRNTTDCLPTTAELDPIGFRGVLNLTGPFVGKIFITGTFKYQRKVNPCQLKLTVTDFQVRKFVLTSKFSKKCAEITTNDVFSCLGCGVTLTRDVPTPFVPTTTTRPPPTICDSNLDIISLIDVSQVLTTGELVGQVKPSLRRYAESFALSDVLSKIALIKFDANATKLNTLGDAESTNLTAIKALIDTLTISGSALPGKISKALKKAADQFENHGRPESKKVLFIVTTSPPIKEAGIDEQMERLQNLTNFIPVVIGLGLDPVGEAFLKLRKIAGCAVTGLCKNLIPVPLDNLNALLNAIEYATNLVCSIVNFDGFLKPNILPVIKTKIDKIKPTDIHTISGFAPFIDLLQVQTAAGLGIEKSSLIPIDVLGVPSLNDLPNGSKFLNTRSDNTSHESENTVVEFLLVDEIEKVRSIVKPNMLFSELPFREEVDEYLLKNGSIIGLDTKSGNKVVEAFQDSKFIGKFQTGYLQKIIDSGRFSLDNEDVSERKKRLDLINLIRDRTLLEAVINTSKSNDKPTDADVMRAYTSADCLLDAGLKNKAQMLQTCEAVPREKPTTPLLSNFDILSAFQNIRKFGQDRDQQNYLLKKASPIYYLLSVKNNSNSRSQPLKEFSDARSYLFNLKLFERLM